MGHGATPVGQSEHAVHAVVGRAMTSVLPGVRWALVDWMVNHRPSAHVDVPMPTVLSRCRQDGVEAATVECWTIGEVIRALWDDSAGAPSRVTVLLGVPLGTSFAEITRLLARTSVAQPDASWQEVVLWLACRPLRGNAAHDPDVSVGGDTKTPESWPGPLPEEVER